MEIGDFPSFCLGGQKSPLLAFAPLLNEEDLTADSHVQFIDATLAKQSRTFIQRGEANFGGPMKANQPASS